MSNLDWSVDDDNGDVDSDVDSDLDTGVPEADTGLTFPQISDLAGATFARFGVRSDGCLDGWQPSYTASYTRRTNAGGSMWPTER